MIEFFKNLHINWVDVVVLIIVVRYVYVGIVSGLTAEIFRFIGVLLGLVFAIHWYDDAANMFIVNFRMPIWLSEFISFLAISQIIRLAFKYGIAVILKILNIKFMAQLEKPGGGIVGFASGVMLAGTLLTLLILLPYAQLKASIYDKSLSGKFLIKSCERTYKGLTFWLPEESTKKGVFTQSPPS